ncbi:hypothetical protein D8674_010190 [Pyrus ussuriensis x Pyrus communis]|uniref:Uncharacterized protein n=1 Tax=Pyrus ussuriensis x Pyrus communis TaxID=2448454 RepID=A0A5N5FA17_9ROSA|nr:hypothetical protein D8674_010190 [Pyrus ussuriensis x Pyrus communis]
MNSGSNNGAVRYEEIEGVLPSFLVSWNSQRGNDDSGITKDAMRGNCDSGITRDTMVSGGALVLQRREKVIRTKESLMERG